MTNYKFSRSLISVVATVGLVASALTGLIYSAPVSASGTATASNFVPANGTPLFQGQKTNFQFKIGKSSANGGSIYVRLADSTGTPFTPTTGVAATSGCQVYYEIDTPASNGTRTCAGLFTTAGIDIPGMNQNSIVTIYVGTSSSKTDTGLEVKESYAQGSTQELKINVLSSDSSANIGNLVGFGPETGVAIYDVKPDVRLSVKKQRITSSADYNTFSGDVAGTYTTFTGANTGYSYVFGVNIENSGATSVTNAQLTEALDSGAAGYFDDCKVSAGVVVNAGNNALANTLAVFPSAGNSTSRTTTTNLAISGGTQSAPSRISYLVACRRNTSTLPTSGNVGNNEFRVDSYKEYADLSEPKPALPKGIAPISGGADLKITKDVIAGATNGSPATSGTTVTYRINITNTSTSSNCSTPTTLVDFIEAFGTTSAKTISTNASAVASPSRCNGATGEFAVNLSDVQAAYPSDTQIGNTMRVIPVREIAPGQTVSITYSMVYNFGSTCPAAPGPAPRIRNSAALIDSSVDAVATGTAILPSATQNGFIYGAVAYVYFDTAVTPVSVTIAPNISLYGDSNIMDNAAYVDVSPDVCRPDMRLVSTYRSTPLTNGSSTDALLGETAEYTIEYQNYAARFATGGVPKSQARNISVSYTLPDGATIGTNTTYTNGLVSPKGATISVSGQTVTISGLPNLGLGDEGVKQVKLLVVLPKDTAKVGVTNLYNVARVSATNEDGIYDGQDKATCVDSSGVSVACSVSSTPTAQTNIGNNSSRVQVTLKGGPDVQVLKTVDIGEGQLKTDTTTLTYTIKAKNIGTEVANDVRITDTLDVCTTFDSKVSGPDGVLRSDPRFIDYSLGNLSINQEVIVSFKAKINNSKCDLTKVVIQNTAESTITGSQTDININNNKSTAVSSAFALNLVNAPLTKTVDQLVAQPGATLTYTINLKAVNEKFEGTLVDTLPTGVTFVSAEPAAVRDGAKLTWSNLAVDAGKDLTAKVKVTADASTTGTIVNTATATNKAGKISPSNSAVTSIEVAGNAKVTGYIYFDANRNKKEDKLERGTTYADYLGGIRVVAKASNGKEYSAITDKTGAFTIDKLPAGKYTVSVDINTVKGSYKNVQLNVAAIDPSNDGLTRMTSELRSGDTFDMTAGFRLFTGQTSTGANVSNGVASISGLVALLSFSFLATLAYAEARKRALSL